MRRLALLLVLVALAGCGGRAPARPDPRADRAAVQARVAAYVDRLLRGDGAGACAQLTPEYRRGADARAKAGGLGSCAEAFSLYGEAVAGVVPPGFAAQATDRARIAVTLHGERAQAAMLVPGRGHSTKQTSLRRVRGRWLIDDLGVIAKP